MQIVHRSLVPAPRKGIATCSFYHANRVGGCRRRAGWHLTGAGLPGYNVASLVLPTETDMPDSRRIVTTAPENSETPLERIGGWLTPPRRFFVRSHFETPPVDLNTWRLHVDGCVERPRDWSFD